MSYIIFHKDILFNMGCSGGVARLVIHIFHAGQLLTQTK